MTRAAWSQPTTADAQVRIEQHERLEHRAGDGHAARRSGARLQPVSIESGENVCLVDHLLRQ